MGVPPGAPPYPPELVRELDAAIESKGPGYRPRTRHLEKGGAQYTNRLVRESSPYLLQHAHNPVDWRPWGDEAFAFARETDRPVFLSIGYSTCHWCHVMEEESFEDEEIATYMNEHYVCIKLDREERPDVDGIYMAAVQAMTGHGGWPMSVWLNHEREPFYTGTYFPARDGDRGMSAGFVTLMSKLRTAWDEQRDDITRSAASVVAAVREQLSSSKAGAVDRAQVLDTAMRLYGERYDPAFGGLRVRQKFPSQLSIRFLLRQHRRTGDEHALRMATTTLHKMADGGMYDHVGGGFHRYSTDTRWLVPHFEKMLYDNALLATAYLEGYQATGEERFAQIAREVLRYVEREMRSDQYAFFSATDADSPTPDGRREEGWFFTWTPGELANELGQRRAERLMTAWGVRPGGNFEGRSILHTPRPLAAVAKDLGMSEAELHAEMEEAKAILYQARLERPPPLRDDKILTSWNGLMISAFAQAALVLAEPRYAQVAAEAASFLLMFEDKGGGLQRSLTGSAPVPAVLDDFAFLTAALLDLFEATGDFRHLDAAKHLDQRIRDAFEDKDEGGFFFTPAGRTDLLVREKPAYDGAEPSGNSVHALSLLRLSALTGEASYRERAVKCIDAFGGVLMESPISLSEMLLAVDWLEDDAKEIVLLAPGGRAAVQPLVDVVRKRFLPNKVLVAGDAASLAAYTPLVRDRAPTEPTAWVCREGTCELPTTDADALAASLR